MGFAKLLPEHFVVKGQTDDGYDEYSLSVQVMILGFLMSEEDMEDCFTIAMPVGTDLVQMIPTINEYVEWFGSCKEEITAYFETQIEEHLPSDWFEKIEVFDVSITFDSREDYGATIAFGESVFADHTVEIEFDKREIIDNRLNG